MSRHFSSMTMEQKAQRRQRIVAQRLSGIAPYDIARKFGLTVNYVRAVLRDEGIGAETTALGNEVDALWSMPEEDRRREFAKRAARGARAALMQPHG